MLDPAILSCDVVIKPFVFDHDCTIFVVQFEHNVIAWLSVAARLQFGEVVGRVAGAGVWCWQGGNWPTNGSPWTGENGLIVLTD